MNFQLLIAENTDDGIKRIIIEQIQGAVNQLNNADKNFDISIHETRKYFKKIRAIVRLVRFQMDENFYKKENIFFRDTGRLLSSIRDAAVMVESIDYLRECYPNEIDKEDYKRVRHNLSTRARRVRSRFIKNEKLISAIKDNLSIHIQEVREWKFKAGDFALIENGLKRIYSQGFDEFNIAINEPSSENFHEWRKRVKYLWYHTKILEEAWNPMMNTLSDKLSELGDTLGLEHDLAELRSILIKEPSLYGNEDTFNVFLNLIGQHRIKLQAKAKSYPSYIYAEPPDQFVNRIKSYWNQSRLNTVHQ